MQKLVERESAPRSGPLTGAPALAVQFFLIPLAVVAAVVIVYGGFRLLLSNERTPEEFLNDIRLGGRERRWPAAYELSRLMVDPDVQLEYPGLGPALVRAFADSKGDDPRVRRYLALAIGRLTPPPAAAVASLVDGLGDADSETRISVIWALASLGDPAVVPQIEALYTSDDAGIRKMVVYALGSFPGDQAQRTLRTALEDPVADVQWNAAVALARHGQRDGLPVLRRMLDRSYVARTVTRVPLEGSEVDPVSEVIISGLDAVGALGAGELRPEITVLKDNDESLKVRQAAIAALGRLDRGSPAALNRRAQ